MRAPEPGTVLVFDPKRLNPSFWEGLSQEERLKYYGPLGYGKPHYTRFVFVCEILVPDGAPSGHCVLVSMEDQHVETMRHTSDFRKATMEEL